MDIRRATTSDRDAVIALWEATDLTRAWNDPVADFDRALTGAASTILVGEEAGALIATVMVGHDGHRGWVYYLAVAPGQQGHGAGAALMRASEAWLVDHGIEVIRLMVRDTNGHVLGFYEALGYERQAVHVLGRRLGHDEALDIAPDDRGMTDTPAPVPPRLAPFLAQWDYITEMLFERLAGLDDEELLWEPGTDAWTVRLVAGRPTPDVESWPPSGDAAPPRTLAWTLGHLGAGSFTRADWLVGSHAMQDGDLIWPMTAAESVAFARAGLQAWRHGLEQMTDVDLDTVGRSAYPGGMDPELPLIEIVWWVSKELLFHAGEAWFVRDLYAHRRRD